ncbi:hypothetical protein PVAP13_9KG032652 [Panicum virgatum]|uniref:Uncharacterized protein n=1 Tax=Panicum virgatum TaxID=38727 RepID=A0A8T0NBU2_PANVG|nr:hypothetical protein PVAP13_9KG032652 [Panicum virgatum]
MFAALGEAGGACGIRTQVPRRRGGTFCCSRVQRFYGMSMCSTCYSVRQTKALFLRWEGFRLQAASWTCPLPIFGAAEARREATLGAGDEDDRETHVWAVL